jgi:hypothetical protein
MMRLPYTGLVSAALLTWSLALGSAFGQTGPSTTGAPATVTPPATNTGPAGPSAPSQPAMQFFDDNSFRAFLRQRGYKVAEHTRPDGQRNYVTTITKDGWTFVVDLSLRANHRTVDFFCPLGRPLTTGKATADELLHLMELSRTAVGGAGFFSYIPSDHQLILYDYCTATPQVFGPYLDRVVNDIRKTYPAWSWANQ